MSWISSYQIIHSSQKFNCKKKEKKMNILEGIVPRENVIEDVGTAHNHNRPSGKGQHAIQIQPIHWIVDQNRSNGDKVYVVWFFLN